MDALLIVDFQNDFTPGGALPVADGEEIAAPITARRAAPRSRAGQDRHRRRQGPGREQPGLFRLQDTRLGDLLGPAGSTGSSSPGSPTDYCVKNTVLDARREGFDVTVVEDALRGVEVEPGDSERALEEMERAGARVATSEEVLASRN
jgi:nicotinamidase/pyrazinamidase